MEEEGPHEMEMEEEAHEKREAQKENESGQTLILSYLFIEAHF
jgi:hypothetical protein